MTLSDLAQRFFTDATNNSSGFYLPFVVLGQPTSLDPLFAGDIAFGPLAAVSPSLQASLCTALRSGLIAPVTDGADLQLRNVRLVGLSNVALGVPAVEGDQVTLPLSFGGASMPAGFSVPQALSIAASFVIDLPCCSGSGGACTGAIFGTPVTGEVTATFGAAGQPPAMTAVLSVAPLGSDGTILPSSVVTVSSLRLASPAVTVQFQVETPVAPQFRLNAALSTAFATPAGAAAVLAAVNQALASPAALAAMGDALTTALPSLVSPPLLAAILSIVYAAATNPTSSVYLPAAILAATNPALDPFTVGAPLDLGDMNAIDPSGGMLICGGLSGTELLINTPGTPLNLALNDVVVSGLSNLIAAPPLVIGNDVYGVAALGALPGWSRQLGITGGFTLSLSCCPSEDGTTCSSTASPFSGSGRFSAAVASAAISAAVTVGAIDIELTATVNRLFLHADPNVVDPQNVVWTIMIADIPNASVWDAQARRIFNDPLATGQILAQIQASMNEPAVLQSLSELFTRAMQSAMVAP